MSSQWRRALVAGLAVLGSVLALVPTVADADCRTYRSSGSSWATTTCDDGSSSRTYYSGNSSTTNYSDGSYARTYQSGNWTTTSYSDGSISRTYQSGNWTTTTWDDGTTSRGSRSGNWGTTTYDDGSSARTYFSGDNATTSFVSPYSGSGYDQRGTARALNPYALPSPTPRPTTYRAPAPRYGTIGSGR